MGIRTGRLQKRVYQDTLWVYNLECYAGLQYADLRTAGSEKPAKKGRHIMAYVVAAIWTAKEGQGETILEVIKKMTPLSRQEPGCLFYQAQRSPTDPNVFFLYEQYVDAAGYEAHMATEPFKENILGKVVPMLETRVRDFYHVVEPA